MTTCPRCSAGNPDGALFCNACGGPVVSGVATHPSQPDTRRRRDVAASWSEARRLPFEYGGSWLLRGSMGEVLLWNASAQVWVSIPRARVPFFMRRPAYRSPQRMATALFVLFGCHILLSIVGFWGTVYAGTVADRVETFEFEYQSDLDDAVSTANGWVTGPAAASLLLELGGIAVVFILWTRRITANAASFSDEPPAWGTGWATGGWFVPVVSFWRPLQVMNQAWRASDPDAPLSGDGWQRRPASPWLVVWWVAFLVGGTHLWIDTSDPLMQSLEQWRFSLRFAQISYVAAAAAAALAIWVVAAITAREEARDRQFDIPAASSSQAWPSVTSKMEETRLATF